MPVLKPIVIGVIAGAVSGLLGLGGGIVIVPLLVFWLGFNQREAAATSALAILPTACVGLLSYGLNGGIDWLAGLALGIGITVGSQIGVRIANRLSLRALEWLFFAFLLVAIVLLWVVVPERSNTIVMSPLVFISLLLFALVPGLAVSMLGIGGGVIAVPVLIAGYGASDLIAKGTSLFMGIFGATSASIKHSRSGQVNVRTALIIGACACAVVPLTVRLAVLITPLMSNILFSAFLLIIAGQYLGRLCKRPAAN